MLLVHASRARRLSCSYVATPVTASCVCCNKRMREFGLFLQHRRRRLAGGRLALRGSSWMAC